MVRWLLVVSCLAVVGCAPRQPAPPANPFVKTVAELKAHFQVGMPVADLRKPSAGTPGFAVNESGSPDQPIFYATGSDGRLALVTRYGTVAEVREIPSRVPGSLRERAKSVHKGMTELEVASAMGMSRSTASSTRGSVRTSEWRWEGEGDVVLVDLLNGAVTDVRVERDTRPRYNGPWPDGSR